MDDTRAPLTVLPTASERRTDGPARFEAWPADVQERCYELWSTIGGRNAARVEWLLAKEVEGAAIPSGSTIRRWAVADGWAARADDDLERTRGQTLRQLQTNWLRILQLSQETLIDALIGTFDSDPQVGALKVKTAEVSLRVLGQAGALTVSPPPPQLSAAERANETPLQGLKRMRDDAHAATQEAQRRR